MGMDLSSLQFSLLLQTGTTLRLDPTSALYQVAQSPVQVGFECLQGGRTLSHSGPFYRVCTTWMTEVEVSRYGVGGGESPK